MGMAGGRGGNDQDKTRIAHSMTSNTLKSNTTKCYVDPLKKIQYQLGNQPGFVQKMIFMGCFKVINL